jgi:delta(3,5)-delta(2,4)-dienoyl-CoA isomerase
VGLALQVLIAPLQR